LKLELIAESVSNDDDDGDGISNNKDNNTTINKIQAGAGKTITSPTNTRTDEWALVVAFNVIVRMPASVLAGSKTNTVSPLALVSVTSTLLQS
jgi:hypothetical protein